MKKEIEKSEWEKEVVYNTVYLPVRFFKKEAYIRIDDYKEVRDRREKVVEGLEEENKNLNKKLEDMRDYASNLDSENDEQALEIEELKKENKKLKEEIDKYEALYGRLYI